MDLSRFREALRSGCVDPWACSVPWKDSPSAPKPPDYQAAANSQQFNQNTPFGKSIWSPAQAAQPAGQGHFEGGSMVPGHYGGNGAWVAAGNQGGTWVPGSPGQAAHPAEVTTTLSPELQKGLEGINKTVGDTYSKPMDLSSVPQIADKAYSAFTSRLDPQWQQAQQQQQTQLANQGLVPGGQAYDNAMRVFNQGKNDAYQQANLGAIQTMPQTYGLAQQAYNQPLNTLNALRTGAQVNGPQPAQQPDYLQAAGMQGQYAQGLYNAQVGQQNAMTSGLFGLGAAGLLAFA